MKIITVIIILLNCQSSFSKNWTWKGLEVLGHYSTSRTEITNLVPLKIGEDFIANPQLWNSWCESIKNKFNMVYAKCSSLRFINFEAYLVINVVEQGMEDRIVYKESPKGSVDFANDKMISFFDKLKERGRKLFEQGSGSLENSRKGYLDYEDSQMSKYVSELIKIVPNEKNNLFNVLKNDSRVEYRRKAATLLNWSLDTEASIKEVYKLLDDPDHVVRNNISRFMLHYLDRLKDKELRKKVVRSLIKQLKRPSHGDRNKALFGLLAIAKTYKEDRPFIRNHGLNSVDYIAKESVLINVGKTAKELLSLIK